MEAKELEIVELSSVPEYIPVLARMCFNEWRMENKDVGINSVEEYALELKNHYMVQEAWPFVAVALINGTVVGSAAVDPNDMEDRPMLRPWMASLLVDPNFRGKGIGSKLITFVLERCKALKLNKLYLWAKKHVCNIYAKRGFEVLEERDNYCGNAVNIMVRNLD
jgi:N-acetylglutamate synthase-like GNAT family acetyltransferase